MSFFSPKPKRSFPEGIELRTFVLMNLADDLAAEPVFSEVRLDAKPILFALFSFLCLSVGENNANLNQTFACYKQELSKNNSCTNSASVYSSMISSYDRFVDAYNRSLNQPPDSLLHNPLYSLTSELLKILGCSFSPVSEEAIDIISSLAAGSEIFAQTLPGDLNPSDRLLTPTDAPLPPNTGPAKPMKYCVHCGTAMDLDCNACPSCGIPALSRSALRAVEIMQKYAQAAQMEFEQYLDIAEEGLQKMKKMKK